MATARCSYLIAKGVARGVDEMWIARQPVLLSVYLHTYAPWLSRQVIVISDYCELKHLDCLQISDKGLLNLSECKKQKIGGKLLFSIF